MNLPVINQLREDESTYICFSKALVDFDKAIANGSVCYFSKMVALNLPLWQAPNFYIDLNSVGVVSTNPNLLFPKSIQYYLENIIRQDLGINDADVEESTELAFWKMLNKMQLTDAQIRNSVVFINDIVTSNFVSTENNNGWGEIITEIPNKCKLLNKVWRTVSDIKPIVQCSDDDTALYDNGDKQFLFDANFSKVLDFNNLTFDEITQQDFTFNCLLLFYKDSSGINKLHGINFIYPWENKVTYWDLESFVQKTNVDRTIGYQFKFNMKTCNNDATQIAIYGNNDPSYYNMYAETLSGLKSFLEIQMRKEQSQIV